MLSSLLEASVWSPSCRKGIRKLETKRDEMCLCQLLLCSLFSCQQGSCILLHSLLLFCSLGLAVFIMQTCVCIGIQIKINLYLQETQVMSPRSGASSPHRHCWSQGFPTCSSTAQENSTAYESQGYDRIRRFPWHSCHPTFKTDLAFIQPCSPSWLLSNEEKKQLSQ